MMPGEFAQGTCYLTYFGRNLAKKEQLSVVSMDGRSSIIYFYEEFILKSFIPFYPPRYSYKSQVPLQRSIRGQTVIYLRSEENLTNEWT